MIVRPVNMTLPEWADTIVLDLGIFGVVGRLDDSDWQAWGVQFLNNFTTGRNMPNPYQFGDWKEWAERMCEVFA